MSKFPIPDAALDDRLGFVGTSGSGKTYNASAAVERLLADGARVVIVDPLDVWWGLRLSTDGKREGFKLPIFGGDHGDLPLNQRAGKIIGETVATMEESCIISLGAMATKEAERQFMLNFLEAIYRKANGSPFHLIFDEADLFAPQGAGSGSGPKLQALMEQIVRRGRVKGFIPWLITQRPAVISKDVLSQVDGLVAFKMTSSQDRKAIGEWVRGQADTEKWSAIWSDMPTMTAGRGVVWIPARGVLETVQFPKKETFDSSRTPKRGERKQSRDLRPLDIDGLMGKLASIEDDAKANDPVALRKEVQRLKRELVKAENAKTDSVEKIANGADLEAARENGRASGYAEGIAAASEALKTLAKSKIIRPVPVSNGKATPALAPQPSSGGISNSQQRVLDAIAWWEAFGITQPSNEQVAFVADYSPKSGGFNNLKGGLRTAELVEYPKGGHIELTDEGRAVSNTPSVEPTQQAFHEAIQRKLSDPQWRVLSPAIAAYPDALESDAVAEQAGYSPGSGGFNNLRGGLRTLGLINYPSGGMVKANDWLFP